jgi:hypothetical protein
MGTPLVVDNAKLGELKAFAEEHFLDVTEMRRIVAGETKPPGLRDGHGLDIEIGYRVVFSIEEHPLKDGSGTVWYRHMSMSQAALGRYPNEYGVALVAKELGFPMDQSGHLLDRERCSVWVEDEQYPNVICEVEKPDG